MRLMSNARLQAATLRYNPAARPLVVEALRLTQNNWTQAAAHLGISFRQFRYLMKLHGDAINADLFAP